MSIKQLFTWNHLWNVSLVRLLTAHRHKLRTRLKNTAVTLNSSLHFIGFISNLVTSCYCKMSDKQPSRKNKSKPVVMSHSDYMSGTSLSYQDVQGIPVKLQASLAACVATKNRYFKPKHDLFLTLPRWFSCPSPNQIISAASSQHNSEIWT